MKKKFDCVKMKHEWQRKLLIDSKAKNSFELVTFMNEKAKSMNLLQK